MQAEETMRLLIVEDDTKLRTVLQKGLEEESFAVDACSDGATATAPPASTSLSPSTTMP